MLEASSAECMSSDEEIPKHPQKGCVVIHKTWRSFILVSLYKWLDKNLATNGKKTVASGSVRGPIKHIRKRKFLANSPISTKGPLVGLPENFYNPTFLATLDSAAKARLQAKPAINLPAEVLNWPTNNEFEIDLNDVDEYWRPPPK
jgi:hypothetical protein